MSTAVMPQTAMYDFGDIMLKVNNKHFINHMFRVGSQVPLLIFFSTCKFRIEPQPNYSTTC